MGSAVRKGGGGSRKKKKTSRTGGRRGITTIGTVDATDRPKGGKDFYVLAVSKIRVANAHEGGKLGTCRLSKQGRHFLSQTGGSCSLIAGLIPSSKKTIVPYSEKKTCFGRHCGDHLEKRKGDRIKGVSFKKQWKEVK